MSLAFPVPMRRKRLAGLVAVAALAAAPARAQEPEPPSRARNAAIVTERPESAASPTRLRVFLDDTVLSPSLVPRLAFSAALDHRDAAPDAWGNGASGYGKRMAARAGLVSLHFVSTSGFGLLVAPFGGIDR